MSNLLLFFDRPWEPCFMPKGAARTVFQLQEKHFPARLEPQKKLISRFCKDDCRSVALPPVTMPDLTLPLKLPYHNHFSLFMPSHQQYAEKLIEIFMSKDLQDTAKLTAVVAHCQLHVNPYMFIYCLSVAMLHRPGMKRNIVSQLQTFPDLFIEGAVLRRARELLAINADADETKASLPVFVDIPQEYTASAVEPEQRVAYFREDIGVNLHHWHWHLVYPASGEPAMVNKDRRGELFYYMHQQVIARFTAERFCNKLGPVERYSDLRATIAEGYFPKMDSQVASRAYAPRFRNVKILDLDRPDVHMEVSQMERWRDLIIEAIEAGAIELPTGEKLALDEVTGIDTLGNLVEASTLSRNPAKYGNLHNMGHNFLALAHDPDNRFLEESTVMGDPSTAMRDPIFYRWHAHMDDIFNMHKAKLPAYTPEQLEFPLVHVASVVVRGGSGADNVLATHWERSIAVLPGLDFGPRGHVAARFIHLQHEPFQYHIEVENNCGRDLTGAVRIFLAPENDENGQPLCFEAQRRLMIELDKFSTPLRPGHNAITRKSEDSSVTIPYERTFRNQDARPGKPGSEEAAAFDFCGCGWPHHLLLPKGTVEGYPVVLFVMVSDWDNKDRVETASVGLSKDAASYCGIRDQKYPDRRAMGFPFDRPNPARALDDFLQHNMAVRPCIIRFSDVITELQIEKRKRKTPQSNPHHHCCHDQSKKIRRC